MILKSERILDMNVRMKLCHAILLLKIAHFVFRQIASKTLPFIKFSQFICTRKRIGQENEFPRVSFVFMLMKIGIMENKSISTK